MSFDTAEYWDTRYGKLGFGGAGSVKKEAVKEPGRAIASLESRYRERLKEFVPSKVERVLDFGAGVGRFVPLCFEFGRHVTCVDVSSVGLTILRSRFDFLGEDHLTSTLIREGDRLPGEDQSIDVVFSIYSMIHVRAELVPFYVNELRRVGRMVVFIEPFHTKTEVQKIRERGDTRPHINYVSALEFQGLGEFQCIDELDQIYVIGDMSNES